MFNKLFCIGFNKTGTSSMHRLCGELGLRSWHGYYSHLPVSDPVFRQFQCFSDGDQHDFTTLDRTFPGSRFILTTRPLEDWLISRIQHIEYRRSIGASGPMREAYEASPAQAVTQWIECRLRYHRQVQQYFLGRDADLLIIDLCNPALAAESLGRIVKFLGVAPPAGLALPHENSRLGRQVPQAARVRERGEIHEEVQHALRRVGLESDCGRSVFP